MKLYDIVRQAFFWLYGIVLQCIFCQLGFGSEQDKTLMRIVQVYEKKCGKTLVTQFQSKNFTHGVI